MQKGFAGLEIRKRAKGLFMVSSLFEGEAAYTAERSRHNTQARIPHLHRKRRILPGYSKLPTGGRFVQALGDACFACLRNAKKGPNPKTERSGTERQIFPAQGLDTVDSEV